MAVRKQGVACVASLGRRGLACLLQIPRAIGSSLNPRTHEEAHQVQAQLDQVREGLRLIDYAYPLVGIAVGTIEARHAPSWIVLTCWGFLLAVSVCNEILLRSDKPSADPIADVRTSALKLSAMTLIQTAAWISLVLCAWRPDYIPSNMFGVLVVSCTLAVVSMRLAAHAAAVAGPMALLSLLMFWMESRHALSGVFVLFQLAILYTILMIFQACAMHSRFSRTWRLERDREKLIENLHSAKRESDHAHELALLASKAKSEFLANMSHELRTPLNAIIGFSDIVRTRAFGDEPERYSEYGRYIHQSGHHLLELISDILELAKIEAGRKKLHYEPIDLTSLILDEVSRASDKGAPKNVAVSADLPGTLPLLQADLHAVRQMLANLLSNAVKFTPGPGSVTASCLVNQAGEIELIVADTGIGIAPEDQSLLFERFGQASCHITTADRGSGLGLPIVKGLVEMHRGRIRLESTLGCGTSIAIVFPAENTLQTVQQRVA